LEQQDIHQALPVNLSAPSHNSQDFCVISLAKKAFSYDWQDAPLGLRNMGKPLQFIF
jgi:hypothetical protein